MNRIVAKHELSPDRNCLLVQGNLTAEAVDAIVNAANGGLQHGGGVAAAIVRAGGTPIQEESDAWVRAHGEATHERPAVTGAGRLPCQAVIHAVGPVWGSGDEDSKLRAAVTGALEAAHERGFASIALPAVSTGIFGFPKQRGAQVIFQAIENWAAAHSQSPLCEIRVTILDQPTLDIFQREFNRRWK
ncbi:MAG: macro domain-containing protein [Anaerolineales bacterium]|nr:macro domain-containing protein [Anaerolineales bacterium]